MPAVVLFDGVCNFCDRSVRFIIDRDRRGYFRFAPLQSETGRTLANQHGLGTSDDEHDVMGSQPIDSVILIEDGKAYTHSTAALRIARKLSQPWPLIYAFMIVPRPVRDLFYRIFAKCRYRLFGKRDQCTVPTPEVRARFLT